MSIMIVAVGLASLVLPLLKDSEGRHGSLILKFPTCLHSRLPLSFGDRAPARRHARFTCIPACVRLCAGLGSGCRMK